jgi:hypothetical protein
MHALRFLHATRTVSCLGLLGLAALANGCSEENPVTAMGPEQAQQKGKALMEAREKQFGPGGSQKGRPTTPPPAAK